MTNSMIRPTRWGAIMLLFLAQNTAHTAEREQVRTTSEQAKSIIARFGGTVEPLTDYDHEGNLVPIRVVSFANSNLTNGTLLSLTDALACVYQQEPMTKYNRLDLSFTKVTGEGFRRLRAIPNLTEIDLSSTPVHDEGLQELAYLSTLIDISLDYTYITSSALKGFVRANSERRIALSLSSATVVDDEPGTSTRLACRGPKKLSGTSLFCILQGLNKVEGLDLSGLGIRDEDLDALLTDGIKANLKWIDLSNNSLGKNCSPKVAQLKGLWWLGLKGNTDLTDENLGRLSDLGENLNELDLSSTGISNTGLKDLSLKGLTVLDVSNTKAIINNDVLRIDSPMIWRFSYPRMFWGERPKKPTGGAFRSLEELRVSGTGLSDEELPAIALLDKLTLLEVSGTLVTIKGLEKFVEYRRFLYPEQGRNTLKPRLVIQQAEASPAVKRRLEGIAAATITVSREKPRTLRSPIFIGKTTWTGQKIGGPRAGNKAE